MLRENRWHFRHMPILTYVAQFDFITPLDLATCRQRLLEAAKHEPRRGKTHVYEVSNENGQTMQFAAKYVLNQSAWYLAGRIGPLEAQIGNQVQCYTGIPVVTFIIPLLFLVLVLLAFGVANHLSLTALIALFIGIFILTGLVGIRYVRLFRQGLERDIRALLDANP